MKKTVAIILCIAFFMLSFLSVGCAKKDSFAGEWKFARLDMSGSDNPFGGLASLFVNALDLDMVMTFDGKGKGTSQAAGAAVTPFSYVFDETTLTLTHEDGTIQKLEYIFDGDDLHLTSDDVKMIFQRQKNARSQSNANAQASNQDSTPVATELPTEEPTPTPTAIPTATPQPTAIPKKDLLGAWKSCGITLEGEYYSIEQFEDADNYSFTDIYYIFKNESFAEIYIQGKKHHSLPWKTTESGIEFDTIDVIMTSEKERLSWKIDDEILWFERVSGLKSIDDIVPSPYVGATKGQINALKKAASYLSFSSFSYKGLIEQLEFEQFTHEEAVYAVDNCGADWDEQAVKKARSYLTISGFSKNGLIDQLEYEGFTHEQAVYAVEKVGY